VGQWYVSNSGRKVSPRRGEDKCRVAEPPFLFRNQFASPRLTGGGSSAFGFDRGSAARVVRLRSIQFTWGVAVRQFLGRRLDQLPSAQLSEQSGLRTFPERHKMRPTSPSTVVLTWSDERFAYSRTANEAAPGDTGCGAPPS
jgi:hypothetical protein